MSPDWRNTPYSTEAVRSRRIRTSAPSETFDEQLHEASIETLEKRIMEIACDRTGAPSGAIFLWDGKSKALADALKNWRGATVRRTDTRYAITYRFVDKYMSFTNESVVWMNACFSGRNAEFVNAFLRKGAGVYLGWSELLSATAAFRSAPYFVDRMVGANRHPDKESPPQRAFAYNLVLFDMAKKGLDKDPANNGQLQATVKPGRWREGARSDRRCRLQAMSPWR